MSAEAPKILSASMRVGKAHAITASGLSRNRERLVVVGGTTSDITHVHLGTVPQVQRWVQKRQGIDPMQNRGLQKGSCSLREAFVESANFVPSVQAANSGKPRDPNEIREGFLHRDDDILEGAYARALILGDPPVIDESQISFWVEIVAAFGTAWRLVETE